MATTQDPPSKIKQTQTCSQNTTLLIAHMPTWTREITTWWRHINKTWFLRSTNLDFHTVSSHLNKIWNLKSRTDTNMWVDHDEQQLHIPFLALMMQNKCFLPFLTLQTWRTSRSHLRSFSQKVFEFLVFWFVLCFVLGLKGVFVTTEAEVGYRDWQKHTSSGLSDTFQTTGR